MAKLANKDELLEHMETNHDQHFKVGVLLLAAHGGALVTSLSVFKDYANTPQYKGVGVLIILFGVGLLASILSQPHQPPRT